MDQSNTLVQSNKNALETLLAAYSMPSQRTLLREMYLTAVNAKAELDEHLNREFLREFEGQSPAAIEYAFRTWRNGTSFLPAVHEIRALIESWHAQQAINAGSEYMKRIREEGERRVAAGEQLYGVAEVFAEFKKVIDAKTELTPEQKKTLKGTVDALRKGKRKA